MQRVLCRWQSRGMKSCENNFRAAFFSFLRATHFPSQDLPNSCGEKKTNFFFPFLKRKKRKSCLKFLEALLGTRSLGHFQDVEADRLAEGTAFAHRHHIPNVDVAGKSWKKTKPKIIFCEKFLSKNRKRKSEELFSGIENFWGKNFKTHRKQGDMCTDMFLWRFSKRLYFR